MRPVELQVKTGEYVTTVLIPPFIEALMPEVILWGERFFQRWKGGLMEKYIYRECFAVAAVMEAEAIK